MSGVNNTVASVSHRRVGTKLDQVQSHSSYRKILMVVLIHCKKVSLSVFLAIILFKISCGIYFFSN